MKYNYFRTNFALSVYIILLISVTSFGQRIPADLMENCNQWKITYPDGKEDKTLCLEPNNEYFYVSEEENALVFFTPIRSTNGTTPNSKYIRSELRERLPDGSLDIYWTTQGTHMIYVKQAITHLPINKSELVATQIHGNKDEGIDDAMVMRLEERHLFLSFNGGKLRDDLTIKTNYKLGDVHEVIFLIQDGIHYCYYTEDGNLLSAFNNGDANSYLVKDGKNDYVLNLSYDQTYFKVGNYTQSSTKVEGDDTNNPNNYGEVYVYDFFVRHGSDPVLVKSISLAPATVSVGVGEHKQLTTSISPANAMIQKVSFTSSNPSVAIVNPSGEVLGIQGGSATITVKTDDGGFTDTSVITVTGTGTHWPVTGVEISPSDVFLREGWTKQLSTTVSPSNASIQSHRYTSLNPFIVKVNQSGLVTAISEGTTTIKVTSTDGNFTDACNILVSNSIVLGLAIEHDKICISPNPATSLVNFDGAKDYHTLLVLDQVGREIVNKQIGSNGTLDVTTMKSGIYIFKFLGKDTASMFRVIKR